MKRLVIDLDGTLTAPGDPSGDYRLKQANLAVVAKLREYKDKGFEIIIQTARNMRSFNASVGKINAFTLPVVLAWLEEHNVPFDEVHVGKPWCGTEGFYVDDKAIRPAEFVALTREEIAALLTRDSTL